MKTELTGEEAARILTDERNLDPPLTVTFYAVDCSGIPRKVDIEKVVIDAPEAIIGPDDVFEVDE